MCRLLWSKISHDHERLFRVIKSSGKNLERSPHPLGKLCSAPQISSVTRTWQRTPPQQPCSRSRPSASIYSPSASHRLPRHFLLPLQCIVCVDVVESCGGCGNVVPSLKAGNQQACLRRSPYHCPQTWTEKVSIKCPPWWKSDSCGTRFILIIIKTFHLSFSQWQKIK